MSAIKCVFWQDGINLVDEACEALYGDSIEAFPGCDTADFIESLPRRKEVALTEEALKLIRNILEVARQSSYGIIWQLLYLLEDLFGL